MLNEKTTIPQSEVTTEMKVKWLQYFVEHGEPDPSYRYVWIESARFYDRFNDRMKSYLKFIGGRPKNGLTISVQGQKWLDEQLKKD